jgi:hypothetical protein
VTRDTVAFRAHYGASTFTSEYSLDLGRPATAALFPVSRHLRG